MVFVVGYRTIKPPSDALVLLGGSRFMYHTAYGTKSGYSRFVTRDLDCLRDEGGNIKPFLRSDDIEWNEKGKLLIGTV